MTTKKNLDKLLEDLAAVRGEIDLSNSNFIRLRAPGDTSGANVTIVKNEDGGMDHADVWGPTGAHEGVVRTAKAVREHVGLADD